MERLIDDLKKYAANLSVVYVEDNDAVREEICHILDKFFDSVIALPNGKEALAEYMLHRHDLVISDIKMPVMDGVALSKEIKRIDKDQKILITSAYDDSAYLMELINAGIDKFIMKPLESVKFLETLLYMCKHIVNEKELQRHRTNTEAILRSVGEAIITVDMQTKVIEINDAAKKLCAADYTGCKDKGFHSLFGQFTQRAGGMIEETLSRGMPVKANRIECRGGAVVDITVTPLIDADRAQYGAVVVIRDDTYASTLETELNQRRRYDKIAGKSAEMQRVYLLMDSLADTKAAVLITGESGTGKELAAEAIHYRGLRKDKPLIKVNCAALPEGLLESELFGHVRGAFTGAVSDKEGRFQKAHGGTIFLDEIGDIPLTAQIRLLRVLQDLEFERVGSSASTKVDVRVIAATNRDLRELVNEGKFREDLYFRLKVVCLHMPPLRQRRDDIALLVRHLVEKFNLRYKKDIEDVSADVMKTFLSHRWPGNVRELEHAIEHAFVLCNKRIITVDDLPEEFNVDVPPGKSTVPDFRQGDWQGERDRIIAALQQTQWRKNKAAALLGISRVSLYDKLKKYKLDR